MTFVRKVSETVVGGVVLLGVTKGLEHSASYLPDTLSWIGDGASWLWNFLWSEHQLPLFAWLLIMASIWFQFSETRQAQAKLRDFQKEEARLSDDEGTVIGHFARLGTRQSTDDLSVVSSMSTVRVESALHRLSDRGLVHLNSWKDGQVTAASLTAAGKKFVVDHNLDQPPED